MPERSVLEDLATTDARHDHMRGTLELIAGIDHASFADTCRVRGNRIGTAIFKPENCPVCMAIKCLQQCDAAEELELKGWREGDRG